MDTYGQHRNASEEVQDQLRWMQLVIRRAVTDSNTVTRLANEFPGMIDPGIHGAILNRTKGELGM